MIMKEFGMVGFFVDCLLFCLEQVFSFQCGLYVWVGIYVLFECGDVVQVGQVDFGVGCLVQCDVEIWIGEVVEFGQLLVVFQLCVGVFEQVVQVFVCGGVDGVVLVFVVDVVVWFEQW